MLSRNEIIGKNSINNINSSNKFNLNSESLTKQLEEEYIKKTTHSSPKNINNYANQIAYHNAKNFSSNNDLQSKLETFQDVGKLTRRKIAPIEGKNGHMNKTNKTNDFMKYINKTLYPDNNKKGNEDIPNNNSNNNDSDKVSRIKNMSDLKNHLESLNLNTPKNMKKTLNSIAMKNNNNGIRNSSPLNQNNFSNFTNVFSNTSSSPHATLTHSHAQSLNETTFKNFINPNNYGNNFPYPTICLSTNLNNNNNNNNPNHQNQTTKFLFDVSNFSKYSKTESAKYATKPAGIISSFGVNTNFGNVRYLLNF